MISYIEKKRAMVSTVETPIFLRSCFSSLQRNLVCPLISVTFFDK